MKSPKQNEEIPDTAVICQMPGCGGFCYWNSTCQLLVCIKCSEKYHGNDFEPEIKPFEGI